MTDAGPFDHLPLAPPGLEADAVRRFRTDLSPEEYAARFGHDFVLFSYDDYRYRQPGLTEWVQRLGDVFFGRNGAPSVAELRPRYLTPEEIEAAEQHERDPL